MKKSKQAPKPLDPQAIEHLISIYEEALPDVSFPGIDAARLKELSDQIKENSARVEALEKKLAETNLALRDRRMLLERAAKQALAYAKIYAEDNSALAERLDEVALEPARKPSKMTATKAKDKASAPELGDKRGKTVKNEKGTNGGGGAWAVPPADAADLDAPF